MSGTSIPVKIKAAQGTTHAGAATRAEARGALTVGSVYVGRVTAAEGCLHTVEIYNPKVTLSGVQNSSMLVAGLMGVRMHATIQAGTRVAVVYDEPPFILGCMHDEEMLSHRQPPAIAPQGASDRSPLETGQHAGAQSGPPDLLEGELAIGNMLGSMVQFLTTMTRVMAGDRAAVECHLLRNMVRILSDTFAQYTAFGETEVFLRDGKLDVRMRGTSHEHESWGLTSSKEAAAETPHEYAAGDPSAEEGRWRWQTYLGHLGDFINMIVQDPAAVLGAMAQQATGKARMHVGQDGTVLVQSVAEIVFERTVVIPVPVQTVPDHETAEAPANAQAFLRLDARIRQASSNLNLPEMALYLRDYTRWLAQVHGWERVLGSGRYSVPSEAATEWPSGGCGEEDKQRAGADVPYRRIYTTMRLCRDGTITLYESGGSEVSLYRGKVRVSAALDIDLEAGRDIRIRGRNILLFGRRNVEIVAAVGSLVTMARTAWRAMCSWGPIHLRSDADPDNPRTQGDQPQPGDPDPALEWRHERQPSILLEARQDGVALQGRKNHTIRTEEGHVLVMGSEEGSIIVQGFKGLSARFMEHLRIMAPHIQLQGRTLLAQMTEWWQLGWHLLGVVTSEGAQSTARLFARAPLHALTVISRAIKGPYIGPQRPPDNIPPDGRPVGRHGNHVLLASEEEINTQAPEIPGAEPLENVNQDVRHFRPGGALWGFLQPGEYAPDNIPLSRSPVQQDVEDAGGHVQMTFADLNLLDGVELVTGSRTPHTGPRRTQWRYSAVQPPLHERSEASGEGLISDGLASAEELTFVFKP